MQHCFGCHYITFLNIQAANGLLILIHRGSYMSIHVLLNLLNKLGKRDIFYCFFATSLIN